MARKRKRAIGGYRFARFAGQPQPELVEAGVARVVTIGLAPAGTAPVRPLVEKGESVTAGQIMARDDETVGNPVLASVNGTVEDILMGGRSGPAVLTGVSRRGSTVQRSGRRRSSTSCCR